MAENAAGKNEGLTFHEKLVVGGVAVIGVALTGAYIAYRSFQNEKKNKKSSKKKTNKTAKSKIAKAAEKSAVSETSNGACSKETLINVFNALHERTTMIYSELHAFEEQIRSSTPCPPEEEITRIVKDQYQKEVERHRNEIFTTFQTTNEEVDKATEIYRDDNHFLEVIQKLHMLEFELRRASMEKVTLPAHVTLDLTIEVYVKYMRELPAVVDRALALAGNPGEVQDEKIKKIYTEKVEEYQDQLFAQYNLDKATFEEAIMQFREEPRFLATAHQVQMELKMSAQNAQMQQ